MNEAIHPARSTEFLSRLYDGEIDDGARRAFEAHRDSCTECSQIAAVFEKTLAAFRSAPTAPPAADLSARILRKIRAQSPARRPFGVTFGIDIRWAGLFAAALLVVLLAAPVMLRRSDVPPAPTSATPIPARILDTPAQNDVAVAREGQPRQSPGESPRTAPVAPTAIAEARSVTVAEGPPPPASAAEASADEEKRPLLASPKRESRAPAPMFRRPPVAAEPTGGEAGAVSAVEAPEKALRLIVRALDGQGTAPALETHPSEELLLPLRGHEFVLLVESQGRVREIQPRMTADSAAPGLGPGSPQTDKAADVSRVLLDLRFQPGDRPRRLLVRVE